MLQASVRFQPDREDLTADGWSVVMADDSAVLSTTNYATITAALAAVTEEFRTDPSVDTYFNQAAESTVLSTNTAAVASAKAALLTAEGL
jgi:hypothetical protein